MKLPALLSIVAVVVGCGQSPSHLASESDREKVLVVVMGGNTSCGQDAEGAQSPLLMSMHAPFENMRKNLEESGLFTVDYLLSCHTTDAVVHFTASDAPGRLFATDFAGVQQKIDDLYDGGGAHRLILAGHSYGGWLAMKTASVLHEKIATLVTIDPISRKTCSIFTPGGCTQAPTDIVHTEREAIKANAGHWLNFWQKRTFYLHASVIPEADENVEEQAEHTQIDSIPDVWEKLAHAVKASFQALRS